MDVAHAASSVLAALAAAGMVYALGAIVVVARFFRAAEGHEPGPALRDGGLQPSVAVLRPVRGTQDGLERALASVLDQDYDGPIQWIFGVQDGADPVLPLLRRLAAERPAAEIAILVDATDHGSNRKVSNLINMAPAIRHEIVAISDADIVVERDYVRRVVSELQRPNVGAVTLLYTGIPLKGFWPRISAMGTDTHFLPGVLVGLALGAARPCFGSTIALRRDLLASIGGFAPLSDVLADDNALGEMVRRAGLPVVVPAWTVGHLCPERSLREVFRHEVRWARTIAGLDRWGHWGSLVTHAVPLSWLALMLAPSWYSFSLALGATGARLALARQVARSTGAHAASLAMVVARDWFSLAVFLASLAGHDVRWMDRSLRIKPDGTVVAREGSGT